MAVLCFAVCGLAIGGALSIVWWSVDTLIGTHTMTVDKAMALIGLSAVATAAFVGVMMLLDEHGWRRRGHQPRAPTRPGPPPNCGTRGQR